MNFTKPHNFVLVIIIVLVLLVYSYSVLRRRRKSAATFASGSAASPSDSSNGLKMFNFRTSSSINIKNRIVHFDLKGAAPRIAYLTRIFQLLGRLGATGVLIEYEDMFPYDGELSVIRHGNAYSKADIRQLIRAAADAKLDLIPLVQTFGHLEFLLKHEQFKDLREVPRYMEVICPLHERTQPVLFEMIRQVVAAHPGIKRFHIGADEAYHVAQDQRCVHALQSKYLRSKARLMLDHVRAVATFVKRRLNVSTVLMWNDMFERTEPDLLLEYSLQELIEPVVWGYASDVTSEGYFPESMFDRFKGVFPHMWLGSSYKGANGIGQTFIDPERYLDNLSSYYRLIRQQQLDDRVTGIILTGWQRYDHFSVLCELFAASVPSLISDLVFMSNGGNRAAVQQQALNELKCDPYRRKELIAKYTGNNGESQFSPSPFLGCVGYPAAGVFDLFEWLRYLRVRYSSVMDAGRLRGWFGRQMRHQAYASPWHADAEVPNVDALSRQFRGVADQLRQKLLHVYFQDAVDEFLFDNVDEAKDKVVELLRVLNRIQGAASQPNRPLIELNKTKNYCK